MFKKKFVAITSKATCLSKNAMNNTFLRLIQESYTHF